MLASQEPVSVFRVVIEEEGGDAVEGPKVGVGNVVGDAETSPGRAGERIHPMLRKRRKIGIRNRRGLVIFQGLKAKSPEEIKLCDRASLVFARI
jgi:hypothetical protein